MVSLGPGWSQPLDLADALPPGDAADLPAPSPAHARLEVPHEFQGPGLSVRVRSYCVADGFDRQALQDAILKRNGTLRAYADVLCTQYHRGPRAQGAADIYFFDSGVVVFWGLDAEAERYLLSELVPPAASTGALAADRVERDRITVTFAALSSACIEDDVIRLHWRFVDEPTVKLAISFALAESTKLSVFEEDLRRLGRSLGYLPAMMASRGEVDLGERAVIQFIGQLFLQQRAVNLLTAILETPAALDEGEDQHRSLYRALVDYFEIVQRMTLLNDRFGVLHEMLDILRQHAYEKYYTGLENIVIWLVGICSFLAICQLLAVLLGWDPERHNRPAGAQALAWALNSLTGGRL